MEQKKICCFIAVVCCCSSLFLQSAAVTSEGLRGGIKALKSQDLVAAKQRRLLQSADENRFTRPFFYSPAGPPEGAETVNSPEPVQQEDEGHDQDQAAPESTPTADAYGDSDKIVDVPKTVESRHEDEHTPDQAVPETAKAANSHGENGKMMDPPGPVEPKDDGKDDIDQAAPEAAPAVNSYGDENQSDDILLKATLKILFGQP